MKLILSAILVCTVIYVTAQNVDTKSSKVKFEISNLGINTVEGEITGMSGTVNLNKGEVDVCIQAKTISTGIEKRDNHLKTADFFNIEKYPEICFKSTELQRSNEGYVAIGKLTLHGVTKSIKIPLKVIEESGETTLKGNFEVNRFDYGLGAEAYDGTFQIGKTAEVEIICVVK